MPCLVQDGPVILVLLVPGLLGVEGGETCATRLTEHSNNRVYNNLIMKEFGNVKIVFFCNE